MAEQVAGKTPARKMTKTRIPGINRVEGGREVCYAVRVELPRDPITGKRKQRAEVFSTMKTAQAARNEWLTEIERGTAVDGTKMTVGEHLEHWLGIHKHDLRPATVQQYTSLIRAHLIPTLGSIPLARLQPAHLTAMYADKRENGRLHGTGGLAPRSVRHLHIVLHEALDFAVKQQMLPRNVADAVDAPRFTRKEMTTWTGEDARTFLTTAEGDTYAPIWLLMLTTGLRRGEALGVRWGDFDAAKGMLHVRQTIIDVGGHAITSTPKTNAGRRTVRLSPACVTALKEHRKTQAARRLAAPTWENIELVFTTGEGKPVQPRVLSRAFDVLQAKAKVPRIRLHDLRHTHATLLFNDGKNIKMISQRLGHSDVGITLAVYAHLAHDAQDEAATAIDGLLFGEKEGGEEAAVKQR